jgi:hypothetical protein
VGKTQARRVSTRREYNFGEPCALKQLLIRMAQQLASKLSKKQMELEGLKK